MEKQTIGIYNKYNRYLFTATSNFYWTIPIFQQFWKSFQTLSMIRNEYINIVLNQ